MRWRGRRQSSNVEDRRGSGSAGAGRRRGIPIRLPRGPRTKGVRGAGGGSLLVIIVIGAALWLIAGINPIQLLGMLSGQQSAGPVVQAPPNTPAQRQNPAQDQRAAFISVVLAETEDTWSRIFRQSGLEYTLPTLVLYSDFTRSACGAGNAATGPFYCPVDRKVYVDLAFFDLMANRLGAPGDFAQAYVLAHEVGHHVQNLTGVLGKFHQERRTMSKTAANLESIKVELQADCYAGVWAHAADRSGIVEPGDIDEALGAASAVGDDILQRRQQGYVVPETFNHGTAAQRSRWFRIGYQSGNPSDCDTFASRDL